MQLETWQNQRWYVELGLRQFIPTFLEEKMTPDIVCKLSLHEFRLLVIADSSDIMGVYVYCSKYGRYAPQKLPSQSGALKFNIPKYMLENLLEEGFTIKETSAIVCVAGRALYKKVNEYDLSKISFKNDSVPDLDKKVHKICVGFPWRCITVFGEIDGFSRFPVSVNCVVIISLQLCCLAL